MRSRRQSCAILIIASALVLLTGCGRFYSGEYRAAISENQIALQTLRLGMSADEVRRIMGEGEIIRYGRLHLIDPWRSESFSLVDGKQVLILFYVTQPPGRHYRPDDRTLTPIIFEDEILMGWGWSFLNQNTDRYQIMTPRST
jgi:hypothetical protein